MVAEGIPSREKILEIMRSKACSREQIEHGQMVADLALMIADKMAKEGKSVDRRVLEAGALLHDTGFTSSTGPVHGVIGSEIIQGLGLPQAVARIAETHEIGGITKDEAAALGFPPTHCTRDHVLETLEENIVAFADNIVWTYWHEGLDPWIDAEVCRKALYTYVNEAFEKTTGYGVAIDNPIFARSVRRTTAFINYVSKREIDELGRRYSRKQ